MMHGRKNIKKRLMIFTHKQAFTIKKLLYIIKQLSHTNEKMAVKTF